MSAAPDLFAATAQEDWLANRLTQLRADLSGDPGAALKDRLKRVIESQDYEMVIAGRAPNGRPETFAEAWERIFGEAFYAKPTRTRGAR